jgi:hypothetical protein
MLANSQNRAHAHGEPTCREHRTFRQLHGRGFVTADDGHGGTLLTQAAKTGQQRTHTIPWPSGV